MKKPLPKEIRERLFSSPRERLIAIRCRLWEARCDQNGLIFFSSAGGVCFIV